MGATILLADDSLTIQKVVELTFAETDHTVVAVSSGVELLERIDQVQPDLVICDVIMPEKDGYTVCQSIKSNPSTLHVPVILMTGTFEPFDRDRALAAGCDEIITKPFEARKLMDTVDRLVNVTPAADTGPQEAIDEGDEFGTYMVRPPDADTAPVMPPEGQPPEPSIPQEAVTPPPPPNAIPDEIPFEPPEPESFPTPDGPETVPAESFDGAEQLPAADRSAEEDEQFTPAFGLSEEPELESSAIPEPPADEPVSSFSQASQDAMEPTAEGAEPEPSIPPPAQMAPPPTAPVDMIDATDTGDIAPQPEVEEMAPAEGPPVSTPAFAEPEAAVQPAFAGPAAESTEPVEPLDEPRDDAFAPEQPMAAGDAPAEPIGADTDEIEWDPSQAATVAWTPEQMSAELHRAETPSEEPQATPEGTAEDETAAVQLPDEPDTTAEEISDEESDSWIQEPMPEIPSPGPDTSVPSDSRGPEDELAASESDWTVPIEREPAPSAPGELEPDWSQPAEDDWDEGPTVVQQPPPLQPEERPADLHSSESVSSEPDVPAGPLSEEDVDRIARRVVELAADRIERIAWEVIPDMAEIVVRERIRQLEDDIEKSSPEAAN